MEEKRSIRDIGRYFITISPALNHSRTNLLTYKMSLRLMQPFYIACWKYIQTEQNFLDSSALQFTTEYTRGLCLFIPQSLKPLDRLAWKLTVHNSCAQQLQHARVPFRYLGNGRRTKHRYIQNLLQDQSNLLSDVDKKIKLERRRLELQYFTCCS